MNVSDDLIERFLAACHEAAERGLMRCSSGNLSWRIDGGRMLATASRSWMCRVTRDDVVVCRIADAAVLEGPKPTVEVRFHAGILAARPDVDVVMHFQTPCATTLACCDRADVTYFVIPEIPFYIGPIAQVGYFLPGTEALASAVTDAMRDHDLVVMSNHGQVTVARDFDHAIQNAEFFELACHAIVHAGADLRPLSDDEVRTLLAERAKAAGGGV